MDPGASLILSKRMSKMKKENRKNLRWALVLLAAFLLWTAAVQTIDVQAIGPQGSKAGFAALNRFVHHMTGVHMALYVITDWLSLVPLGFAAGFALLGFVQWTRRKSLSRVDHSILVLGGFYIAVIAVYAFFERFVVNCRPVLIQGVLEASYPSSTTVLVLCVMETAVMQLDSRLSNHAFKRCIISIVKLFMVLMIAGRLISGVHWVTDIIGGILLSEGLVRLYGFVSGSAEK